MALKEHGLLSKGITLSYKNGSASEKVLTNLQEIPELGGNPEKVETTVLTDAAHMFINGLLSYGDSVDFTFLFAKEQFMELEALDGIEGITWKVTLPTGDADETISCSFTAESHVRMNSAGTNVALQYTLSLAPTSEMEWA